MHGLNLNTMYGYTFIGGWKRGYFIGIVETYIKLQENGAEEKYLQPYDLKKLLPDSGDVLIEAAKHTDFSDEKQRRAFFQKYEGLIFEDENTPFYKGLSKSIEKYLKDTRCESIYEEVTQFLKIAHYPKWLTEETDLIPIIVYGADTRNERNVDPLQISYIDDTEKRISVAKECLKIEECNDEEIKKALKEPGIKRFRRGDHIAVGSYDTEFGYYRIEYMETSKPWMIARSPYEQPVHVNLTDQYGCVQTDKITKLLGLSI